LIFGLPGETWFDIMRTVEFVAALSVDGVKIHNLLIPCGTTLARQHLKGEVTAPTPERHLEYTLDAIERLPATAVIMRTTCDALPQEVVSPRTFWPKGNFTSRLIAQMHARGARQGRLYGSTANSLDLASLMKYASSRGVL
jgi:hypothetical protein